MRLLLFVMLPALALGACGRPSRVTCGIPTIAPSGARKDAFGGTWSHRVELETIEGPDLGLPRFVEMEDSVFVFSETTMRGIEGRSVTTFFGVTSHFDLVEDPNACGPREVFDEPSWAGRAFARVDWSMEQTGAAASALLPDHRVEPTPYEFRDGGTADEDRITFTPGAAGAPTTWSVGTQFVVTPPDCAEAACTTTLTMRHHFAQHR